MGIRRKGGTRIAVVGKRSLGRFVNMGRSDCDGALLYNPVTAVGRIAR